MINQNRKKAIYSRKSKYTGKGESTQNQIEVCKRMIELKFTDIDLKNDILIYEDEGYSGANMNRPMFQKMLKDIEDKKIDTVVFYKLDRISRNVNDFSNLIEKLDEYNVSFLSATESIENVTPAGKAMMYMISVFAQFERDIIAERIRDNMIELAKTGRWLGGKRPTGYESKQIENVTIDGKKRKLYKLNKIENEINIPIILYKKFLELKSLTKLETYCLQNDVMTMLGNDFKRWGLKNILVNPVYAIADKDTYKYFSDFGIEIYADEKDFNGINGLMVYNKTKRKTITKTVEKNDISEWIVAVGKHEGIIKGNDWVEVQKLLKQNEDMKYRKPSQSNALLSGILRCSFCGSFMRPKLLKDTVDKNNRRRFSYICELKDRSKKIKCQCKNIEGLLADDLVLEEIRNIANPTSLFYKELKNICKTAFSKSGKDNEELKILKSQYNKNEKNINSLIDKIKYIDEDLLDDVSIEIKKLKETNRNITKQINELSNNKYDEIDDKETANIVLNILDTYFNTFNELDLNTKRNMLKTLVSSIFTDGENITLNFIGSRDIDCIQTFPTGDACK